MKDNTQIVRDWFEAWNKKDIDKNASFVSDSGNFIDIPSGKSFHGQNGMKEYSEGWATAFPDGQLKMENLFISGDNFVAEFVLHATHSGVLTLANGSSLKATGKKVELKFVNVGKIKNEKIEVVRNYYDIFFLLRHLGAIGQAKAA